MAALIAVVICVLFLILQHILSRRKHSFLGLICPTLIVVCGIWFVLFIAKPGTEKQWIFKFVILLGFSLVVYFEGKGKAKK
ncbi:hypothetical protein [Clostridium cellulovorans]|uniref:Uncharacterized protein n=1 Tax=Clostridium cellulovorans (strain ATCC 35296 / DSM 3052 / OCM 3 / 743B) TaxID=573061 RepID=D9STR0_CLOC7|nr:hypothetical protein [Clostridium cellulovorans]ADL52794.1 hypothetical protein Clocel_3104 [Clostridium cellulovorans 743B]